MTEQARADERIHAAIADAVEGNEGLIQARARADLSRRLTLALVAFLGLLVVGLLVYLSLNINSAAAAIKSCTDPKGTCYQRAQAHDAANLAIINQASEDSAQRGSVPAQKVLTQSYVNGGDIKVILGILDQQYPAAAKAVRAQIAKEGK